MFASHFTKEPRRTSLHESLAFQWLKEEELISNLEKLPTGGKMAVYITGDGDVRTGMSKAPSKSLDFRWQTGSYTIYASHKYTKEGGGNQDSQFKEVRRLLELFQKGSSRDNTMLLVIVDGPYYTNSKMNDLLRFCRDKRPPLSAAMPIQDVPAWLNKNCMRETG